jgi:Zn-dependent peptidase ImmA (M78 family)
MPVRRKHIQALVARLLGQNSITRGPVPVERIAASLGLKIKRHATDEDLSGFILRDPKGGHPVIGVNKAHHRNRQRFTIAHELGHYLLHEGSLVHVDRERAFKVNLRGDEASKGVDVAEKEANLFAAELLMPGEFLQRDLRSSGVLDVRGEVDAALADWAKRYEVSPQALSFRLMYLGFLQLYRSSARAV